MLHLKRRFGAAILLVLAAAFAPSALAQNTVQAVSVADYAGLVAIHHNNPRANMVATVADATRGGTFRWRTGDQSALVTNDPAQCVYVAPTSASTGASGVWERDVPADGIRPDWCGGANDAARWQAAVDYAAGGLRKISASPGKIYSVSGCTTQCILINANDAGLSIEGNGATIASTGSGAFYHLIKVSGTDGTATTIASASARNAVTIVVASATGFAVGDLIRIDQDKTVTTTFAQTHWARITNIASTTFTLDAPLPFATNNTATTKTVTKVAPVENVVIRNLTLDKSGQTVSSGTPQGAILMTNCAYCTVEKLHNVGNDNGIAFQTFQGFRNTYIAITSYHGGGGPNDDADIQFGRESYLFADNIKSEHAYDFGVTYHRLSYSHLGATWVENTLNARGLKLETVIASTGGDWHNSYAGTTGIMLARGTSYNAFSDIFSAFNGTKTGATGDEYGLWLDNDDNVNNTITGLQSHSNGDQDLFVHTTSTGNMFVNVRLGNLTKCSNGGGSTNKFFNVNGYAVLDCFSGAGSGPEFAVTKYKTDAAADGDFGGFFPFRMKNSASSLPAYCYFQAIASTVLASSENGLIQLRCLAGGVDTPVFQTGYNGTVFGSPTGGAQGVGTVNSDSTIYVDGVPLAASAAPQMTVYTTGSGTYTTPAGAKSLIVKLVGGGGGGAGSGTSPGAAGAGGQTTFGTALISANGGSAGSTSSGAFATGGTASGCTLTVTGGTSGGATNATNSAGGKGGDSFIGGGGAGGTGAQVAGVAGVANTGGGGGGGAMATNVNSGSGGGGGGYCETILTTPNSTYSYAVGAAGTAGTAGTGGAAGGAGAAGIVIVIATF